MLLNDDTQKVTFVKAYAGKFYILCNSNDPGAKHRVTETGKDIYYQEFNAIKGFLKDVFYDKKEYEGKTYRTLNIVLESGAGQFCLQLDIFSRAARIFLNVLENIDPSKEVVISISRSPGEKKDNLFVKQRGETLKWKYTQDHPGDRPSAKMVVVAGKETWDYTDQLNWFIQNVIPAFRETLKTIEKNVADSEEDVFDEDLPF